MHIAYSKKKLFKSGNFFKLQSELRTALTFQFSYLQFFKRLLVKLS